VSATIGCDCIVDLVFGDRRPYTVHFNFVVVANHATLGRPTIHQIAARALAIISLEFRVEALMPFIVPYSVVSFLRRRVDTKKHGDRGAEQRDELAPFQLIELHSIPASRAGLQNIELARISQRVSEPFTNRNPQPADRRRSSQGRERPNAVQ
jgi:hypothetical protein